MSDESEPQEWVLLASIPFEDLKREDLEECVYWLLDAMGAKELEWRKGGTGMGAADGGRDLAASFYVPDADGEMTSQKWWIDCAGRSGTVEADKVKTAVTNAQAYDLDFMVIATNTQFSNPTRDWIEKWQEKYPKPIIHLWDHAHLERFLSRHPDVVLRLFSEALSLQGRFQAMEIRFWNRLEYVHSKSLDDIWRGRPDVELSGMGLFAAIANEFASGNITHRPWAAALSTDSLIDVLEIGLLNVPYLSMRFVRTGSDQKPLFRTFAYLILIALDRLSAETVNDLVLNAINRDEKDRFPEYVQEFLLMPIVDQLLSEMQDVCTADYERIHETDRRTLTEENDEIDYYWQRLQPDGVDEPTDQAILRLERGDAPCKVGFPVDRDNGCPLFAFEPSVTNTNAFFQIIKRVAQYRKTQAAVNKGSNAG